MGEYFVFGQTETLVCVNILDISAYFSPIGLYVLLKSPQIMFLNLLLEANILVLI